MRARGVSWFSITDHDTTRAYERVDAPGQHVVTGIEINTTWNGSDVHILGYRHPDRTVAAGGDHRAQPRAPARAHRHDARGAQPRRLSGHRRAGAGRIRRRPRAGPPARREGAGPQRHGPRRPDARSTSCSRAANPATRPRTTSRRSRRSRSCARSGGVPVLAHPGRLKDHAILDDLAKQGSRRARGVLPDALVPADRALPRQGDRYGLVMTAGSDFHDERWNTRGVGVDVDAADLQPFLDLVA